MKRKGVDFIVGIFVLVGLGCIAYMAVKIGGADLVGASKYNTYTADFSSVAGLSDGARIEIAGVQVGTVESISLKGDEAVATLTLKVEKRYSELLDDEAIAAVKTSGLIGDKYIKIKPGGGDPLEDGDELEETESAIDLEELISKYVFGGV